jgi:predicted metalloprotease with PDZ domain
MSANRSLKHDGEIAMNHLLRPIRTSHLNLAFAGLAVAACLLIANRPGQAQAGQIAPFLEDTSPLLAHTSVPGYLGVDVTDVDADKAQALKLKDVHGAVITLIDHDAPAGQIGLKVNDVVLAINGQNVDGAEQLRRLLREIPPGRKISLEISRDGNIQTIAVQLVDRKAHGARYLGQDRHRCRWHCTRSAVAGTMGIMGGGDATHAAERLPYRIIFTSSAQRGRAG